jgi:hypothetical protein
MSKMFIENFHWYDIDRQKDENATDAEKYNRITGWARKARGQNPRAFDTLTEWILDDSQWNEDKLALNEQILTHGIFVRFKEQNKRLRSYLMELEPSGVVNKAVFKALDDFDRELSGLSHVESETVAKVFDNFSIMKEYDVRRKIAGNKTGPEGTDSVNLFGYINHLKNCDAQVQWCLFMPDVVKSQQNGFQVDS